MISEREALDTAAVSCSQPILHVLLCFELTDAKPGDLAKLPLPAPPVVNSTVITVTVVQKVKSPEFLNYLIIAGVAIVSVSLFAFLPGVTMCYFWKKSIGN